MSNENALIEVQQKFLARYCYFTYGEDVTMIGTTNEVTGTSLRNRVLPHCRRARIAEVEQPPFALRGLPATYAVALPRLVDFQEPRHHFDAMQMQDHRFWRLTHAGQLLTGF